MTEAYREPPAGDPTCQRCNEPLVPINVVDHGDAGRLFVGLAYTIGEVPDRSIWTGKVKNASGIIRALLCQRCQLVAWYAYPGADVETA